MEEIRKDMLEDDDDNDDEYLNRLKEGNGSGLVNTRIADRESEVCKSYPLQVCAFPLTFCSHSFHSTNASACNRNYLQEEEMFLTIRHRWYPMVNA